MSPIAIGFPQSSFNPRRVLKIILFLKFFFKTTWPFFVYFRIMHVWGKRTKIVSFGTLVQLGPYVEGISDLILAINSKIF